ncbi:MAG: hypothetical protein JRF54_07780 [Deltaproteobacteria bacterium]|nr:hypothetical protein [Deltaproteobacteria bacterium]
MGAKSAKEIGIEQLQIEALEQAIGLLRRTRATDLVEKAGSCFDGALELTVAEHGSV